MDFEIQEYRGSKKTCAMCERHFKIGDFVFLDGKRDNIFCCDAFWDSHKMPCCARWVMENKEGALLTTGVFVG